MRNSKQKKVELAGWKVGSAKEFLGLGDEESAYLEIRFSLSRYLKKCRSEKNLTQTRLAELLNSSQSRVAKMEAGDPSVSIDLLIKSLLILGKSSRDVGRVIALENT